jgi:hypothetical protein
LTFFQSSAGLSVALQALTPEGALRGYPHRFSDFTP